MLQVRQVKRDSHIIVNASKADYSPATNEHIAFELLLDDERNEILKVTSYMNYGCFYYFD